MRSEVEDSSEEGTTRLQPRGPSCRDGPSSNPPLVAARFRSFAPDNNYSTTTTSSPHDNTHHLQRALLITCTPFSNCHFARASSYDRAFSDFGHCHCHLTASPQKSSLINLSSPQPISIATRSHLLVYKPTYSSPNTHRRHVWTRKTRPVSRRDHEGHQARPRRSRPRPSPRCCRQVGRRHRCPSRRHRQEDQSSQGTQECRTRCRSHPGLWREQDHRQRSRKLHSPTLSIDATHY